MSPIVCGTDYSQWSEAAVSAAAALASRLGEELWLVHAIGLDEGGDDALRQAAFAKAELRLKRLATQLPSVRAVRTQVMWGAPAAELLNFAQTQGASLLVVGSKGSANTPLMRVGATAERVAGEAELPVLVIRHQGAFEQWALGDSMRVLIGIDETLASDSAVRWVEKLRELAPLDVVLGHVYYPDLLYAEYGLPPPIPMFSGDRRVEALVERDLQQRLPTLRGGGTVSYRARFGVGRTGDHLVELAEAERCQLIVVGSHARKGLSRMWSVSAAALHLCGVAVAVVPPDGASGRVARKPELRRVLVATDFSECGNAAIPWAYSLVAPGGELTLAHVVIGELGANAAADLDLSAKLRALPGVGAGKAVTRTEVLHGLNAASAINQAAARVGADLIVVGSHGRSGFKRAALGSVAEEILRASHRPVFVVRSTQ